MDLLKIGLVSDKVDAYALRDAADWVVKPRLLAVPGVAHAIVFGGKVREMQIPPDLRKLASFNLTLTDVADAARAALAFARRRVHRHRRAARAAEGSDPAAGHRQARQTPWSRCATARRSGCATWRASSREPALRSGDALIMGRPGVLISMASQYGANTLTTTLAVERVLADLEPTLKAQGITLYRALASARRISSRKRSASWSARC